MKNYTSEVPVERTITRIEQILAKFGARNILKDYGDDRELASLSFTLFHKGTGKNLMIRMPVNVEAVRKVLMSYRKRRPYGGSLERMRQQAGRTAWRLQQDWLEVQLSLIELEQVEALQVFLPYLLIDGRQTFYKSLQEGGFKMLPEWEPNNKED